MVLDRQLFLSLEKDRIFGGYLVLNDQNFVAKFYADSDEEAIKIFRREYCKSEAVK